jgi:hypothetical protein
MAEFTPPEVSSVIGLVDTYLRWKNANQAPRGFEKYHPSAFGKCLRLMQYQRYVDRGYIPAPEVSPEPSMIRIWDNGHSLHERWRSYFEELGVLRGYWRCNNPLCSAFHDNDYVNPDALHDFKEDPSDWYPRRRWYGRDQLQGCFKPEKCVCGCTDFYYAEIDVVSEELNFYGHCDMILDFSRFDPARFEGVKSSFIPEYLPKRPVVLDMKSINMFNFQDLASEGKDFEYMVQLMVYANILDCDYGILVYENKNNQKVIAFKVEKSSTDMFENIKQQAKKLNDLVSVVDEDGNIHHKLPPPRPRSRDSKKCEHCEFSKICHASPIWEDPELDEIRKDFYGELLEENYLLNRR